MDRGSLSTWLAFSRKRKHADPQRISVNWVTPTLLLKAALWGLITAFVQTHLARAAPVEPEIWLAPLSNVTNDGIGAADFMDLVTNEPAWKGVESHIRVFKLYPFFVGRASDDALGAIIVEMQRHGIAIALEARALSRIRGCAMTRGDGGEVTMRLLRRIKKLGGEVTYLAMDEPLKHALTGDVHCRATFGEMAEDVADRVKEFRTVYPRLKVGDIEPIGAWPNAPMLLANTVAWIKAYAIAVGEPLAFFHADVGWSTEWLKPCTDLQQELLYLHIPFGMIYSGNDLAPSATTWAEEAKSHFRVFEAAGHRPPDTAIFQTWRRFPDKVLPETDSITLTGITAAYISDHQLSRK